MDIFISWSGKRSKRLAEMLDKWLQVVIQAARIYFTPDDIEKGTKWNSEISKELEVSSVGLICLTTDNCTAPWILFEAGALSKHLDKSRVCPILFGLEPTNLTGPLVQFQFTQFNKDDFKRLIETINKQLGDNRLPDDILDMTFEEWWPKLESQVLEELSKPTKSDDGAIERSDRELLEELLSLVRDTSADRVRAIEERKLLEELLSLVRTVNDKLSAPIYSRAIEDLARTNGEKRQDLQLTLSKQLRYANNMLQRATQELFASYKSLFLKKLEIPINQEEYEVFKAICLSLTMQVRKSLEEYLESCQIKIEDDISISVKLILPPKNILELYSTHFAGDKEKLLQKEQWVITAFRDPKTFDDNKITGKREVVSTLYSIEGNTAFRDIVVGRKDRFAANDLKDLYKQGLYKNENPQWHLQYNSTLVVPMVLDHYSGSKDECRYLGFLAVDSLNLNNIRLYDSDECFSILNHAALVLTNYFLALILYHDVGSSASS